VLCLSDPISVVAVPAEALITATEVVVAAAAVRSI
jgi:hypothetical protein